MRMSIKKDVATFIICLLVFVGLVVITTPAEAASRTRGYYKPKSGTYVQPHYRSSPNRSKLDNWSSRGNINPYSGKVGTKDPFKFYSRRGY